MRYMGAKYITKKEKPFRMRSLSKYENIDLNCSKTINRTIINPIYTSIYDCFEYIFSQSFDLFE